MPESVDDEDEEDGLDRMSLESSTRVGLYSLKVKIKRAITSFRYAVLAVVPK